MPLHHDRAVFDRTVLPHLDAAYNLARWLTRDDHNAEDVLQESCLRAYQYFNGFRGGNAKSWFLTIVRNTCFSWLEKNRASGSTTAFDEQTHGTLDAALPAGCGTLQPTPEAELVRKQEQRHLQRCLEELPLEFREILVLRELEGLSYREIGEIAQIPIGTVMSRLSRGRDLLQKKILSGMPEVN